MPTRIIAPLDGSMLAETVLPHVRHLAKAAQLQVNLMQVAPPSDAEIKALAAGKKAKGAAKTDTKQAERYLKHVAQYFAGTAVPVSTKAVVGIPAIEIISAAEKQTGAIIAMSTHGRSGIGRWLIGSVADKVVHFSPRPVLLVRPAPRSPVAPDPKFQTVIVPLDGSSVAEQALAHVTPLAKAMNLTITLLRVNPEVSDFTKWESFPGAVSPDYVAVVKELDMDATTYLAALTKKLKGQGVAVVKTEVLHGDAADRIITLAADTPDCFIAMTTRGRSGAARAVLGSVADRVVRHSDRPVLVIPPSSI